MTGQHATQDLNLDASVVGRGIAHLRRYREPDEIESLLDRYGFFQQDLEAPAVEESDHCVIGGGLRVEVDPGSSLFTVSNADGDVLLREVSDDRPGVWFELPATRRFFGLGDQGRSKESRSGDRIEHRGVKTDLWCRYNTGYAPIPLILTNDGVGLLINTTRRIRVDLGHGNASRFGYAVEGHPDNATDLYVFQASDLPGLIERYTRLTGRPMLPPLWGLGLWFLCHTKADAKHALDMAMRFRDEEIPCDAIGLEPGWMEKFYDFSTDKDFSRERFWIPPWVEANPEKASFLDALRNLGYKPGLWLNNDYDLTWEEERRAQRQAGAAQQGGTADDQGVSGHTTEHAHGAIYADKLTKPDEPWFEHLRRFVRLGVDWFKNDPAVQVNEHPDRLYGNGRTDAEVHNLYPMLWSRQQREGFIDETHRRAFGFTCSGWVGLQHVTGTWTGDTGGGAGSLTGILNLSLSGHGLSTCDMESTHLQGIHLGLLLPWALLNGWSQWNQPWFQAPPNKAAFRDYAELRYRLLPTFYAAARQAHDTGMPILRAMPLMWERDPETYRCHNQFMIGDALLVGALANRVYLPEGTWHNFWTGEILDGGGWIEPEVPENRGGPLLVRGGYCLGMGPLMQHVADKPSDALEIHLYPSSEDASSRVAFFDDDGLSFDYLKRREREVAVEVLQTAEAAEVELSCAGEGYDGMADPLACRVFVHAMSVTEATLNGRSASVSAPEASGRIAIVELPPLSLGDNHALRLRLGA